MYESFRSFDFDIERLFDEFIVHRGGQLVRDLVGKSPAFDNADYVFPKYEVVLELKTLQNDYLARGGYLNRLTHAFCKVAGVPDITPPGQVSVLATQNLFSELRDVKEEPLRRILKKANRQLRDTAIHFGLSDPRRVVLLNNDGLLSMGPDETVRLIASILGREFSHIDAFVYFTTNFWLRGPEDEPVHVWAPSCSIGRDSELAPFLAALGMDWFDFLGKRIGGWRRPPVQNAAIDWARSPDQKTG